MNEEEAERMQKREQEQKDEGLVGYGKPGVAVSKLDCPAFSALPTYLHVCLVPVSGQLIMLTWLGLTVTGCAAVLQG